MSAEIPGSAVQINLEISNLSLPVPLIFLGSLSDQEHYIDQIGAEGLEVTPVRSHAVGRIAYRGAMLAEQHRFIQREGNYLHIDYSDHITGFDRSYDWSYEQQVIRRLVRGVHSSFRREHNDNALSARPFPVWPESLVIMRGIQTATGNKLPAVLYPQFDHQLIAYHDNPNLSASEAQKSYAPFAARYFQPKAHEWGLWGLTEQSDIEAIRAAMKKYGFSGITWDVFHSQGFTDPLELCRRLSSAGLILAAHLALNRKDLAKPYTQLGARTQEASEAFGQSLGAAQKTLEGEMLTVIVHDWKTRAEHAGASRSIVLEKPPQLNARAAQRDDTAVLAVTKELIAAT